MRKLSHAELLKRQEETRERHLPFCAILNNIRSLYNVGSIFRTADGCGLEKLWLCGITGIPPSTQISKTALGAEDTVAWEYREHALELMRELKQKGYQIVLLEQIDGGVSYSGFEPEAPVCLVVGNEISGVCDELLEIADQAVEIEMTGLKNSLNVTVAFGIVAYHFRRRLVSETASSNLFEKGAKPEA